MTFEVDQKISVKCYHCGTPIGREDISLDGKLFCCNGCKSVYKIISGKKLYQYYNFNHYPGITPSKEQESKFDFLDDPEIKKNMIDFTGGGISVVNLYIPQIHCSSCIWLLENLHVLNPGIFFSRVDFLKKQFLIKFAEEKITFRQIVELLSSIGYEPELTLASNKTNDRTNTERSLYLKIGVAAFCFGNIMLFSLPEYLSSSTIDIQPISIFSYINLFLSIPVFFYSSQLFFISAYHGLKQKVINIDVPIALGIIIVFVRSISEVILKTGPGYFDSLSGLVFFLLIGRLFQNKTFESLNFERKYQSYFPLGVTVLRQGRETAIPIGIIKPGERFLIRNNEVIPADSVLMAGSANIDYSFVTGESKLHVKNVGDVIYAGAKHHGSLIELETIKEVSESKFIQLWNEFNPSYKIKSSLLTLSNTVGKYFTIGILLIALFTTIVWWIVNPIKILDAVTAILIVACPCALALAAPFVFGTTLRIFGRKGFYLKHSSIVEALSKMKMIVFDKTGTITQIKSKSIHFIGNPLTFDQRKLFAALVHSSTHPLSRSIYDYLAVEDVPDVSSYTEVEGGGILANVNGTKVQIGSAKFVGAQSNGDLRNTVVYAAVDGNVVGKFLFENTYREGLQNVLENLGAKCSLSILSGDGDGELEKLKQLYPKFQDILFGQEPSDKLRYIKALQIQKNNLIMVGDGLNDAGALMQSDVAIAVTEDVSMFSPSCDAILNADSFKILDKLILFASTAKLIVYWAFGISFVYNLIGLYFAIRGELSPIIAAILMPLSSITVVGFSTLVTKYLASRKGLV